MVEDSSTSVERTPWQPGDEVMAIVLPTEPRKGAYAEQIVVPAASVAWLPKPHHTIEVGGVRAAWS